MELVGDTNIVFSLFKKDSFTRKFVKENNLKLLSPDWLSKELDKYAGEICLKAKIPLESFGKAKKSVLKLISIREPSKESLSKTSKLISHKSDVPFLALSLEHNIPIWSNDPHFQEESIKEEVKVFKTNELKDSLEKA